MCTAGTRLYVHRRIFDKVVEGVSGAAGSIKLGPGLDQTTADGPAGLEGAAGARARLHRVRARSRARRSPSAAKRPSHPGYFVKPTVLVNVKPEMKVVREEIFGPVLVAQRFDDLDEVVRAGQ